MDFQVRQLGLAEIPSPLGLSTALGDGIADYTPADAGVTVTLPAGAGEARFELAGPRERLYFDGPRVSAGIVTCGGLCPGMNDVIRGVVRSLWRMYGVRRVVGFRFGYAGMVPDTLHPPIFLDPDRVDAIHHRGGSVLGSSRGAQDARQMMDLLERMDLDIVFAVGGDGTMRGAHLLAEEAARRGRRLSVIGLPKTIDNDLPYVERSFGFQTAVGVATQALRAAHVEAEGAYRGVGIVKLMGRHAGFVAATAALASGEVDLVLVPERSFGVRRVAQVLGEILDRRGHALVVVAEGAGQDLVHAAGKDASGNARLADIGIFLRDTLHERLPGASIKYIDPSYMIRAAPADSADAVYCGQLAEHAVHAAMSGRTDMVVGLSGGRFTHVPLQALTATTKQLDLDGDLWRSVVDLTRQPYVLDDPT
ncbi:MAG: ATP-dependent 6-phosphofructokinase [Deltaproteobacteria bacterium]|nr:ATP-dependent 6-phosphofructokinase [Deltaproteobacteria bacterium]